MCRLILLFFLTASILADDLDIKKSLLDILHDINQKEESILQKRIKEYKIPKIKQKKFSDGEFRIYIKKGEILYLKEKCLKPEARFFLHIYLKNKKGFENFDFTSSKLKYYDNYCTTTVKIPSLPIKWIDTGQFIEGKGKIWWIRIEPKL